MDESKEEESLNPTYEPGKTLTPIPVDVKFDNELHSVFQQPLPESLPGGSQEVPGFFETAVGKFKQLNPETNITEYVNRKIEDNNPINDSVDKNWKVEDDKNALLGIRQKGADYVLAAENKYDLSRRRNYILDRQEEEDRINRGSIIAQGLGGLAGATVSLASLVPVAQAVKYPFLSQEFIQNLPKMIPGIGVSIAASNAAIQTNKIGGNLWDWAIDTVVDTAAATVFMGVGLGLSHGIREGKLFNARGIIKMANKGIDARPVLDEKGVITSFKAVATDGSVGAAEMDLAQAYLDSALSKNFLYGIPYIGDHVGKAVGSSLSWLIGKVHPIIRMSTSVFSTQRGLINNVAEHAFVTKGMEQGREIETPFETMMSIFRGTNIDLHTTYNGFYMSRNGIDFDPKSGFSRKKAEIETMYKNALNKGLTSKEEFGREVQQVLISEEPSAIEAVNSAAEMLKSYRDPLYLEYLKIYGISDKILKPKLFKGYVSRVYHTKKMELEENKWIEQVSDELKKYDAEINELMQPVLNIRKEVEKAIEEDALLARSNPTSEQKKLSSENIEGLKRRRKELEDTLQNHIRENEDVHLFADDIHAVSAHEAQQIETILNPSKKMAKDIEEQKVNVAKAKDELARNKQATTKAKTKVTAEKRAKLADQGIKDVEIEETKLKELQDKYDLEQESLQDRMHNKQIPQELYTRIPESNRYKLKDPSNRLKLRDVYESDFYRQVAAKSYYDSILNQTAEDNIRNIMTKAGGHEKENPLIQRTVMLRDEFLHRNEWLHPDAAINVMNYRNVLGRKVAIKKVLDRLTVNGTFEELITRLSKEHSNMKADLYNPQKEIQTKLAELKTIENPTETQLKQISDLEKDLSKAVKKYEKQVTKLGKKYAEAKEDMELTIAKMQGINPYSKKARERGRIANLWAVATKLGFLPFTMAVDTAATVFKFGLWPTIRDGLLPMLKNFFYLASQKEGEAIKETAAHAHLAISHLNVSYSDKNWTGTSQTYEPVQGKLMTGMETLAHVAGNFSGANYVENWNQRLVAQIIQSKIIRAMRDFKAGNKIKEADLNSLLRYGINPEKHADSFVKQWETAGSEGNGFGGYQSNYWKWGDQEAANLMSQAILRASRDTVIRRGMFDAPFGMDNPIINSLMLFKGYTLATVTRYLAPLMQKPDAQKLIGTMLMMSAGAIQNPLRRIVMGKDPVQKDDAMFENALRDGGVFSSIFLPIQEMDYLTHGLFTGKAKNERLQNLTEMGILGGPLAGGVNDLTRIVGMVGSGEYNKADVKRAVTNTPLLWSWQFRAQIEKWIDNGGLPPTRKAAGSAPI